MLSLGLSSRARILEGVIKANPVDMLTPGGIVREITQHARKMAPTRRLDADTPAAAERPVQCVVDGGVVLLSLNRSSHTNLVSASTQDDGCRKACLC